MNASCSSWLNALEKNSFIKNGRREMKSDLSEQNNPIMKDSASFFCDGISLPIYRFPMNLRWQFNRAILYQLLQRPIDLRLIGWPKVGSGAIEQLLEIVSRQRFHRQEA